MTPVEFGRSLRALGIRETDRMELRHTASEDITFSMLRDGVWKHVALGFDKVGARDMSSACYRVGSEATRAGLRVDMENIENGGLGGVTFSFTKGESE